MGELNEFMVSTRNIILKGYSENGFTDNIYMCEALGELYSKYNSLDDKFYVFIPIPFIKTKEPNVYLERVTGTYYYKVKESFGDMEVPKYVSEDGLVSFYDYEPFDSDEFVKVCSELSFNDIRSCLKEVYRKNRKLHEKKQKREINKKQKQKILSKLKNKSKHEIK